MGGIGPNPKGIKSPDAASSITQYRATVFTSNEAEVDTPSGANDATFAGIAQEDQSTTGDPVPIATEGSSYLEVSEAVSPGDFLRIAGTGGKAEVSDSSSANDDYVIAKAMGKAGSDGDVIPVKILDQAHQWA